MLNLNILPRLVRCLYRQGHTPLRSDILSSVFMSHSGRRELTHRKWTFPPHIVACGHLHSHISCTHTHTRNKYIQF